MIDGSCIATFDFVLGDGLVSLALSNDGTRLAFGLYDSVQVISDVLSDQSVNIRQRDDLVQSILFSQDSDHLMLGTSLGSVEIWDISDLKRLQDSEPQAGFDPFSSDSYKNEYFLSHFADGSLETTNISNSKREETTEFSTEGICTRNFSHDNFFLALGYEDCSIRILERKSLEYLRSCDTQNEKHGDLHFSHDDTYLASISERGCFRVWEIATGACVQRLDSRSGKFTELVFLPSQVRLASKTKEGEIRIWDTINGDSVEMLRSSPVTVTRLHFSHDSRLLAAISSGSAIHIWDTLNGKGLHMFKCRVRNGDFMISLAFTYDDERLASGWYDEEINIWDIASSDFVQTLWLGSSIYDVSVDPSDTRLQTKIGIYAFDSMIRTSPSNKKDNRIRRLRQVGYGVSPDLSWITHNSKNLVWIPPEFRPDHSEFVRVHGPNIAMIPPGRAIVFEFIESEELVGQFGSVSERPSWRSPVEDDWTERKRIPQRVPSAELERFRSGMVMSEDEEEAGEEEEEEEEETVISETESSETTSDD